MVRVATSLVAAVIALSSVLVSAAPTKRQDIPVQVPEAGGAGASSDGGLNQIDLNGVDTADPNGSLGGTVDIPSSTSETIVPTTETVVPPPPVETVPVPPPVETPPPAQHTPEAPPPSAHQTWPQYGSGSVDWHVDYNSCIQTCVETHPTPGSVVTIPPEHEAGNKASPPPPSGGASNTNVTPTGTVIEILVEPSSGVFHVVPAFVPAAIGDTVRFTVVNNQHNIIQSSVILPCNATAGGFTSGPIGAGQTFTHVVDTLEPTFFFVEGKCQEGMFGAINPPTGAPESTTTVGALMPDWTAANPDLKAALDATELIAAQTPGITWGNKFDVKDVPSELYTQVASNVIFTRGVIGQNAEMVGTDGVFRPKGTLIIPADVSTFLTVADQGGYPAEPQPQAPVAAPSPPPDANVAAAESDYDTDTALAIVSPRVAVAGVAILAAFFVL